MLTILPRRSSWSRQHCCRSQAQFENLEPAIHSGLTLHPRPAPFWRARIGASNSNVVNSVEEVRRDFRVAMIQPSVMFM